jgi:hypothetical protein
MVYGFKIDFQALPLYNNLTSKKLKRKIYEQKTKYFVYARFLTSNANESINKLFLFTHDKFDFIIVPKNPW